MGYVFRVNAMMALSTTLFFMTYAETTEIPTTSTSDIKCELVDCQSGFICIDTELGPRCIMPPTEVPTKPGQCPTPQEYGTCAITCQSDAECRGTLKCCTNACGGTACVVPQRLFTCANVDCQSGFICIDTELGPRCIMPPNVCELPSDSGPCLAYIPRYFYNSTSAKCEQFIYGGCQGNANRFTTEADCYGTCGQCPFFPAVVPNCERNDTCSLTGPNVCPTNTKCCLTPCGNACLIPT